MKLGTESLQVACVYTHAAAAVRVCDYKMNQMALFGFGF
jgi:hypothetical protein